MAIHERVKLLCSRQHFMGGHVTATENGRGHFVGIFALCIIVFLNLMQTLKIKILMRILANKFVMSKRFYTLTQLTPLAGFRKGE